MKVNSRPWDSQYSDWELSIAYQIRMENMNEYQRKRVLEAMDNEDKLTGWELDFIKSLGDRDERRPDLSLSPKENHILNRISQSINA